MDRRQKILVLARAAEATFSTSEWVEVGYLTAADQWVDRHPRLLRSLSWGDPDYKGHVFDAIAHILDTDDANLKRLVEYEPIATWLKTHEPGQYQALLAEVQGLSVPEVVPTGASEAALAALADAQVLLDTRGPTSERSDPRTTRAVLTRAAHSSAPGGHQQGIRAPAERPGERRDRRCRVVRDRVARLVGSAGARRRIGNRGS